MGRLMGNFRFKSNPAGFAALMNSDRVQQALAEEGQKIADRAEQNTKTRATGMRNPDYVVRVEPGNTRASCFVWAANINSFLAEAHDRALSKAVDG